MGVAQETIIDQNSPAVEQDTGRNTLSNSSVIKSQLDPTGALLRSMAFPGWGQYYNHKHIKAGIVAIGEGLVIYYMAKNWGDAHHYQDIFDNAIPHEATGNSLPAGTQITERDSQYWASLQTQSFNKWQKFTDERNKYTWILTAIVFLSMFDAYVDAQLSTFDLEMEQNMKSDSSYPLGIQITYHF